jgi:NAD(P)-dependent dehydrogenase (short-subunit alcohol dehydrogenase family)
MVAVTSTDTAREHYEARDHFCQLGSCEARRGITCCSETAGMTDADAPTNVRDTLLGRLPRLAEVADTAVYLASAGAGAMTGAIVNLSCGAIID